MWEVDIEHLQWLVDRRSKVQNLSLALCKLLTRLENDSNKDQQLRFLGIIFSLWRAVFLVKSQSNHALSEVAHHDSKRFLELLIHDNAINYPQDKVTTGFGGGYYLNNAFFRIRELWRALKLAEPSADKTTGKADHNVVIHILNENGDASGHDRCKLFDAALYLAESIFQELSEPATCTRDHT